MLIKYIIQVTTVELKDLPGSNMSTLGQCTGLQCLKMINCNLVAIEGLQQCKQLQYLDLKVIKHLNPIWIYDYLYNQCLSPLTLWVWIPLRRGVLDATSSDKVCQWLAAGQWFSSGTLVSSTNKTDHHDIAEIVLKVALSTLAGGGGICVPGHIVSN